MRPLPFLLFGLAVAAGELVLAAVLSGTVLGPYFAACAALTVAVAVGGARLLEPGPRGGRPPRGRDPVRPGPPPWRPDPEDLQRSGEVGDGAHEDARVAVPG